MWTDPIVEEVRAARDAYAKKFGYDLVKIGRDLQKKDAAAAKLKPKPSVTKAAKLTANKARKRTGKLNPGKPKAA